MNNGKKVESKYLDPIDNILYNIAYDLGKIFIKLNITPNMITTMSLLFALTGIYKIYNQDYKIGAVLYFIAFFFDCMDGGYARTYNMTSKFGDKYDHFSDWLKALLLIICILLLKIKNETKILLAIISIIFAILSSLHLGCQERIKKNSDVLQFLTKICPNEKYINYLQYFGFGTAHLVICSFIFNIKYINKLI